MNVTAPVGREAMLTCVVQDLGSYKVSTPHAVELIENFFSKSTQYLKLYGDSGAIRYVKLDST